jgi:hypothetical protein
MNKDRVAGSAKKIKGAIKEVVAKPSRSRRRSYGNRVTETALISDVVPPAAPERRPRQRYGDWGFCYIRSAQAIQSRDKDDLSKSTSRPAPQSCPR